MLDEQTIQDLYRSVSASMHNQAVDILYESNPAPEQVERLIELAHLAHWQCRADKTAQNISVAQWLLSRACLVMGREDEARTHLAQAREIAASVPSPQAKEHLVDQTNRIRL